MNDIDKSTLESLRAATLSTHLDTVQNFRLHLQEMNMAERTNALSSLKLPNESMTLLDELLEWKHMLESDFEL